MELKITFYWTHERDLDVYRRKIICATRLPSTSKNAAIKELLQFSLQEFYAFRKQKMAVYIPDVFECVPTEFDMAQALKHTRQAIALEIEMYSELVEIEKINKIFVRHRYTMERAYNVV